jgi:hypothetical protein
MEPSPYSGDDFAEVVVAMGADCSVKSGKVLDKFTVIQWKCHRNRASFCFYSFPTLGFQQEFEKDARHRSPINMGSKMVTFGQAPKPGLGPGVWCRQAHAVFQDQRPPLHGS